MSFSPIAFIAPNYRDYKNNWLKAYEPGTTTPKTMSLNDDGSVLAIKVEINKDGFIESAGGALVIPYIDEAYDLWMFPTELEADANDTSSALRVADNIVAGGAGSGSLIVTIKETETLSSGQLVVDFDGISVAAAEIYIGKNSGDRGRLFVVDDYTITGDLQITLNQSYDSGTVILAELSSSESADDLLINDLTRAYYFLTIAAMQASVIVFPSNKILIAKDASNAIQKYKVVTTNTGIALAGSNFAQIVLDYPAESPAVFGSMQTSFVGHRGVARVAPENTMPSIQKAGDLGFWGVEFDVRITSDDVWVLMHDDTVDRTTDGTGLVSSFTLAGIKALDAGTWFNTYYAGARVPTLTETLQQCKRYNMVPTIELKGSGYTDNQLQILLDTALLTFPDMQFLIMATEANLLQLRALNQLVTMEMVVSAYVIADVDKALLIGRCAVAATTASLIAASDSDIKYAGDNGVTLTAYTVNDPDDVNALTDRGVRMIITDFINLP